MAMNGRFEQSAYGVFAAMVLDSLDGRVARMTNSTSRFGIEYDSLCDLVTLFELLAARSCEGLAK